MKATLKVLALLLIAVMMIGMFAGCQQPTPPTTTAKPNEGTNGPDGTTEKTLEPKTLTLMVDASSYDSFDFQRFVDGETNIYPWFMEKLKEKNLTIKFELIQHDQYDVALQTTLADPDTMPDYIWLDGGRQSLATEAATNGLFLDIQTILEYSDGTASGWHEENPAYFALTQYAGKNWWIGEYGTVFWGGEEVPIAGGCPTGMQLREDWINILKVKYPEYETTAGWPDTIEELGLFVQRCQEEDVNGNGQPDETLFSYFDYHGHMSNGLDKYLGIPQQEFVPNLLTGELDTFWEAENVKEYFKTILEWADKGWIDPALLGIKASSTKYLSNNKVALFNSYFCNGYSLKDEYVPEGAEKPKFSGCLIDTTVHPDGYYGHDQAPGYDNRMAAFSASADPEACARLLDILYSEEWRTMILFGTEGDSYFVNNAGEKVLVEADDIQSPRTNTDACIGRGVFSFNVFPQMGTPYHLEEDAEIATNISEKCREQFDKAMEVKEIRYCNQPATNMTAMTEDEAAVIAELETDYLTTSAELYVKILKGELNVDTDWDAIMQELKDAGYEEIKAVYEARYERFLAAMG